MPARFLRNAIVLGLLSAIGPFAIDMYLPALPTIGKSLGADAHAVQMSLMVFFIAIAVCQLAYGPVADMVGRKLPLYFGLGVFAVGSVGCALASDVETLIAFRFVQGVGACAGMVVPRAIVRDLHTGVEAAKLMSLIMLVFSVSPILAPLAGSIVIEHLGWRAIFWFVLAASGAAAVMIAVFLPETRPPAERIGSSFGSAVRGYRQLLGDRHFLGLAMIGGFGISSFFAYLANSSFVLIDHFGLTPMQYGIAFAVNAIAFFSAAQLNGKLAQRFGLRNVVRTASAGHAAMLVLLFAITVGGVDRFDVMMVCLFLGFGFLGLVIPTSVVLALEEHGPIAGTASALMGTLHFLVGTAVMGLAGLFLDGTSLPMVAAIAACSTLTFLFAQFTLAGPGQTAEAPAE